MDTSTTNRYALMFAHVCIEMNATTPFPENINLVLEDGSTTSIGVEYPSRPAACTLCKVFDHSNRNCPRVARREWIPRPVLMAQRKPEDVEGWITFKKKNNSGTIGNQAPSDVVGVELNLDGVELNVVGVEPLVEPNVEPIVEGVAHAGYKPPKTPVKEGSGLYHISSQGSDESGKVMVEERNHMKTVSRPTRKLLLGSSSGHKKRKKNGHSGQGGADSHKSR
ncbi:zf-CCHC_4 domain-containing protein [Cephalotus follicularis]|uniref:Zf-CCHC_4 domain-containing protein n=1 Tax=Cephalotus follicularis TaxID=3775 RepID=A0A1Q3CIL3_CEPFO|nr:zf-CCHC_4 domain-containing protein [Cephalotus follicularis]